MAKALTLHKFTHPHKDVDKQFKHIYGLDEHKSQLLVMLQLILDKGTYSRWKEQHHEGFKIFADDNLVISPLVIFSGDVGCGKTELAQTIATPLAIKMGGKTVHCFETPSDIRGGGHVGELSTRITEAFEQAKTHLPKGEFGILIIDEGDDIATSREQNQAHHEDRAGVNVLIKEMERIASEKVNLAVILITNRLSALDPAVVRRASLHLNFNRPAPEALRPFIERLLDGTKPTPEELDEIIEICKSKNPLFNFSDIRRRAFVQSFVECIASNKAFGAKIFADKLRSLTPSPTFNLE
jgi:AAA+ superfamily predicted ATPase